MNVDKSLFGGVCDRLASCYTWSTVSKHQIQPGCGEWAGWGWTGPPNLTRETKLSGAKGDRKFRFPCSADHEQDWQTYPVDAESAESYDHTYTPY